MKCKFAAIFILIIFISSSAACSGGSESSTDNSALTAEMPKTPLRWNICAKPSSLDPNSYDTPKILSELLFAESALSGGDAEDFGLVDSWEADDANKTWTLHLKRDIYWVGKSESGNLEKKRPVNSEDIENAIISFAAFPWNCRPAQSWKEVSFLLEDIEKGIKVLDESTLSIDFEQAHEDLNSELGIFLSNLTNKPAEQVQEQSNDNYVWDAEMWFRSDTPYYVSEWSNGDSLTLIKNPFNPLISEGLPNEIQFTWESPESALQKFNMGDLELVEMPIGNGPFMMAENWQRSEYLILENLNFLVAEDVKKEVEVIQAVFGGDEWRWSDAPNFTSLPYTYQNSTSVDTYKTGSFDPDSIEGISKPGFEDLAKALESGELVTINTAGWVNDYPALDNFIVPEKYVVSSINRIENADGSHNIGLVNPETGEQLPAWLDERGLHIVFIALSETIEFNDFLVEIFQPMNPTCYYGTVYIAMNLDVPPYNDVEVRKSLAAITDRESYMLDVQGNTEGLSYALIPQQLLGEFSSLAENYTTTFEQSTQVDLSSLGGVELAYCGGCEGSDVYAGGVTSVWGKNLGTQVKTKAISHEQYQKPIQGSSLGMTFSAGSTNSWFDFAYQWVKEGWIMVPESEYENYLSFVEAAALESDPYRQALMIMEINRLLVEEYASVIPLYWSVYCE